MATKKKSNKVFVYIGKVLIKGQDGKLKPQDKYLVMSEDLAKFVGATYLQKPPDDKKFVVQKGALKGRTITRSQSVAVTGSPYALGYRSTAVVKKGATRSEAKVKWIPIHVPVGVSLREFLKVVTSKFSKKPAFLKTPSGKTTALVNA
jgi:hypothetical protein